MQGNITSEKHDTVYSDEETITTNKGNNGGHPLFPLISCRLFITQSTQALMRKKRLPAIRRKMT